MAADLPGPGSPGRPLAEVLEIELEGVLQAVFAARQDVLEVRGDPVQRNGPPERHLRSADLTLQGCLATLQILLGLLRTAGDGRPVHRAFPNERMSDAFCVMRVTGDVLYMNAAVTRLVGRDHRDVVGMAFEDRVWSDRERMRAHLRRAHEQGTATEAFDVVHGAGHTVHLTFHTERIDTSTDSFLLMSHVRPEAADQPSVPRRP